MDLPKAVTPQGKAFDKNLESTMSTHHVHEGMISEKEELRKKIFNLAKAETLVRSDEILKGKLNKLESEAEAKGNWGFHENEDIMSFLFNTYIMNDPKYLQKYLKTVPIIKKRRDKTGDNSLEKSIQTSKAHKEEILATHPDQPKVEETTGSGSSGGFSQALDYNPQESKEHIDEITGSGSSGQYSGISIWAADPSKARNAKTPMYKGGSIIQESNYLNDAKVFEEFIQQLNENDLSFYDKMNKELNKSTEKTNNGLGVTDMPRTGERAKKVDGVNNNTMLYVTQDLDKMNDENVNILHNDMTQKHSYFPHKDNKNLKDDGVVNSDHYMGDGTEIKENKEKTEDMNENKENMDEVSKSKAQQRYFGLIKGIQAGTVKNASPEAKKTAAEMKPSDVNDFTKVKPNAPERIKEDAQDFYVLRSIIKKLPLRIILADALKLKTVEDLTNYANSKDISVDILKQLIEFYLEENLSYTGTIETKEHEILLHVLSLIQELEPSDVEAKTEPVEESSMIDDKEDTMANKATGSSSMGIDASSPSSEMKMESINKNKNKLINEILALDEINKEFDVISEAMTALKEDRKPSAIVLLDRLKTDNGKNFKKDMKGSETEQTIEFQNKMQADENDIKKRSGNIKNTGSVEVGEPHELAEKLEDLELETTDGKALKNVGDSNIDKPKGDEIIKRNLTDSEQDEYNTLRKGQQSLVYDNDPGKKFTERTEKEMGKYFTDIKHKQYDNMAKMPQYNKDTQPVDDGNETDQYDKYKEGYNKPVKTESYNIAGKFIDALNKTHFVNFNLSEAKEVSDVKGLYEILTAGFGNTSSNTMKINEEVAYVVNNYKFWINESKEIFFTSNKKEVISESTNPALEKMKKLFNYDPKTFVETRTSNKNRGF